MDGSMQLALMTGSINTVGAVKPQSTGSTARPVRRVEQSINTDITQIARGCRSDVWVRGRGPEVDVEAEMNLRTVQIAIITAAIPLCYVLNKLINYTYCVKHN